MKKEQVEKTLLTKQPLLRRGLANELKPKGSELRSRILSSRQQKPRNGTLFLIRTKIEGIVAVVLFVMIRVGREWAKPVQQRMDRTYSQVTANL